MLNLELDLVEGYTLFGVRTKLNDFTLAYNLNKKLNMNFFREDDDLTMISFNQKIYFSLFNFYDEQNDNMWTIIKNKARIKNIYAYLNISLMSSKAMNIIRQKSKINL